MADESKQDWSGHQPMLDLLRDLEWSGSSGMEGEDACCPECHSLEMEAKQNGERGASDEHGHDPKCRLARFVYGPVSEAQLLKMAAYRDECDRMQREWEAKSEEQRRAETIETARKLREWEDQQFAHAVRRKNFPGLP